MPHLAIVQVCVWDKTFSSLQYSADFHQISACDAHVSWVSGWVQPAVTSAHRRPFRLH